MGDLGPENPQGPQDAKQEAPDKPEGEFISSFKEPDPEMIIKIKEIPEKKTEFPEIPKEQQGN